MSKAQQSALYKQIITQYGQPENWPELILTESIEMIQSLSTEDLEKIKQKAKTSLVAALKKAQNVEWSRSQVFFLIYFLDFIKRSQIIFIH